MRLILIAVAVIFGFGAFAGAASLTPLERQHLAAHMEMTESWLAEEVSGLSPAQARFRPSPEAWSVLEVVDHLTVSSPIYWRQFHEAMRKPPVTRREPSTDADILWYGIDRTQRGKAIPGEETKGQLRDVSAGLELLRKLHAEMRQYIRTTSEDLRGHLVEREGSDAYQWLLLISSHEQRHVLQIREIKADPKFPKR